MCQIRTNNTFCNILCEISLSGGRMEVGGRVSAMSSREKTRLGGGQMTRCWCLEAGILETCLMLYSLTISMQTSARDDKQRLH